MRARRPCWTASGDAGRSMDSEMVNSGLPFASAPFRLRAVDAASPPALSTITIRTFWSSLCLTRNATSATEKIPISGTIRVPMTKPFVFTRVTYSRLTISQILRMGGFLDEDVVERRLEQLETVDLRARFDCRFQNLLRIGARFQLGFHSAAEPVDAGDGGIVQEGVRARELDVDRVLAVGLLDGAEFAIQNVPALVDQADGVAHFLDLLHAVRREDDRR